MMAVSQLFASSDNGAQIGSKRYSAEEIDESFEAYLQFAGPMRSISRQDSLSLFSRFFEELIAMQIYQAELKKRRLSAPMAQLEREILENPPKEVRSDPLYYKNGVFDQAKYESELQKNPQFKQELIDNLKDTYNFRRLVDIIKAEVKIDSLKIKQKWLSEGEYSEALVIFFNHNLLQDIRATEEDAFALYEKNINDYYRDNGRRLFFVRFSGSSSRKNADNLPMIEKQAEELYRRAKEIGLKEAAEEKGYELKVSDFFSENDDIIRGIGREPGLIAQAFKKPVGELLAFYQSRVGDFYICQIAEEQDGYHIPFEVNKDILMLMATAKKRQTAMYLKAGDFVMSRPSTEYLTAADSLGYEIFAQKNVTLDSPTGYHGVLPTLNRAILSTAEGDFTPLVIENGSTFLGFVIKHNIHSERQWNKVGAKVLQAELKAAQDKHLDDWYNAERAKLKLVYPAKYRTVQG